MDNYKKRLGLTKTMFDWRFIFIKNLSKNCKCGVQLQKLRDRTKPTTSKSIEYCFQCDKKQD